MFFVGEYLFSQKVVLNIDNNNISEQNPSLVVIN